MLSTVTAFLRHLHVERNASELTLKSYAEDFESFYDYLRERTGGVPDAVAGCASM